MNGISYGFVDTLYHYIRGSQIYALFLVMIFHSAFQIWKNWKSPSKLDNFWICLIFKAVFDVISKLDRLFWKILGTASFKTQHVPFRENNKWSCSLVSAWNFLCKNGIGSFSGLVAFWKKKNSSLGHLSGRSIENIWLGKIVIRLANSQFDFSN